VDTHTVGVTFAQWLHYPTPDVPRTADGKSDLKAPPPRLPDGRPDLSGIWQSAGKIARYRTDRRDVPRAREVIAADGGSQ
jgi:hypothetical protein